MMHDLVFCFKKLPTDSYLKVRYPVRSADYLHFLHNVTHLQIHSPPGVR